MSNPHDVTKAFEADLCAYTGAPYAVAVNSCTMAILLACAWYRHSIADGIAPGQLGVSLPKLTYVGAAMSAMHAGFAIAWRDENWQGEYQLEPLPVWDAARRFTGGMFQQSYGHVDGTSKMKAEPRFQCVSFHVSKILGHSQGGAILHGDAYADKWLRRARFDGRHEDRTPKEDWFDMLGWHCYMSPDVAAALRWKLASLPRVNADLPRSDYPDLSAAPIFGGSGLAEQPANV
jgi:dTDP-4-amino-4,6-dideoxygalactose transaminase